MMEITLVKAAKPGGRDRAYLEVDGLTRRGHSGCPGPCGAISSPQPRKGTLRPGNDAAVHDFATQNVRICMRVFLINARRGRVPIGPAAA
jgi:hypothetical protein